MIPGFNRCCLICEKLHGYPVKGNIDQLFQIIQIVLGKQLRIVRLIVPKPSAERGSRFQAIIGDLPFDTVTQEHFADGILFGIIFRPGDQIIFDQKLKRFPVADAGDLIETIRFSGNGLVVDLHKFWGDGKDAILKRTGNGLLRSDGRQLGFYLRRSVGIIEQPIHRQKRAITMPAKVHDGETAIVGCIRKQLIGKRLRFDCVLADRTFGGLIQNKAGTVMIIKRKKNGFKHLFHSLRRDSITDEREKARKVNSMAAYTDPAEDTVFLHWIVDRVKELAKDPEWMAGFEKWKAERDAAAAAKEMEVATTI